MSDHEKPVLFMRAKTPFESKVIVGVLESAGIETLGATGNLMDEFAATQRSMNLLGVEIFVRPDKVEAAKAAVAAAKASGQLLDADELPATDKPE